MAARDKLVGVISEIHRRIPKEHNSMTTYWGFRAIIDSQFKSLSDKNKRRLIAAVLICVPRNTYKEVRVSLLITKETHYVVFNAKKK
jgi:hypothetical protein